MSGTANADQHAAWNGDSGRRWAEDPDRRDHVLASIAAVIFDSAELTRGEAVLDIGCGCGATTLAAADFVGSSGTVLGLDLSEPMLDVASARARKRGVVNVRFDRADVQTCLLPGAAYDVAISRFGTMFFADQVAAFANVASAVRPRGRLCLATWQPLAANEWLTIPGSVLLRYAALPEAIDGPGMFAQSDPAALADVLASAGFDHIAVRPITVPMHLGDSMAEAADYLASSGPGRALLDAVADDIRPAAIDAVRSVLTDHVGPDGVRLDAAIWLTTAIRSD